MASFRGGSFPLERINAAGEVESDRRSARWNLLEALVVFGVIELSIWGLVAELGMARGSRTWLYAGHGMLGLCVAYMVAGSGWVHGDGARAWGLPTFGSLRQRLGDPGCRGETRRSLAIIGCALALALWQGWPNLLARLGVRRHFRGAFEWFTTTPEGVGLGIALGVLTLLPAFALAIRWDNFEKSVRSLAPVAVGLWLAVPVFAVAYAVATGDRSGLQAGEWFVPHPDRTSVIFYLMWGFVQLGLFLGYFNTRIRKGIGNQSVVGLPARAWAALLTGILFGAIHLPSLPLAGLTAIEGTLLAWYFQSDATRNLFVVAVIHAVGGTLFSAMLPVSTSVGPWN